MDPRLGVIYVEGMLGGYWALTEKWRERDSRRQYIANGQIAPDKDFNVIHIFKRDVPMESIASYVETHWGQRAVPDPVKEAARIVEASKRVKAAQKEERMQKFDEKQEYQVIHTTDHERRLLVNADTAHPMVQGFGDAATIGRGKKKPVAAPEP